MRSLPILFVSLWLILGLLTASSCTLITQVDRSKIGEGGEAGAGSDSETNSGGSQN